MSVTSEASPSKDLRRKQECDTNQKQDESSIMQPSTDAPTHPAPAPELYGYSIIGNNIDKNASAKYDN